MHENAGQARLRERYEVGRLLGRGGMAEIYEGYDLLLSRHVAIKLLPRDRGDSAELGKGLQREAKAAALLSHPNVVAVHDVGLDPDAVFIVMEYLDGETLQELIARDGPLAPHRAMTIAASVCAALEAAHAQGLVHRDITPSNVMVCREGHVKVMDFGIAYLAGGDTTVGSGQVLGTAAYLSPEQAQGRVLDGRSDIYSLGCCLYQMLTGTVPFNGPNAIEVAGQHVRERPLEPRALEPGIPPDLESVVLRAMAKQPSGRYQSAAQMKAALDGVWPGSSPVSPALVETAGIPAFTSRGPAVPGALADAEVHEMAMSRDDHPGRRAIGWTLVVLASATIIAASIYLLFGVLGTLAGAVI